MKLTVKNIGPVKESTIDLDKNLLVLCGGNNTGKTYVAYTVYSFYSSFYKFINKEATIPSTSIITESKEPTFISVVELVRMANESMLDSTNNISKMIYLFFGGDDSNKELFSNSKISFLIDEEFIVKKIIDQSFEGQVEQDGLKLSYKKKKGNIDISFFVLSNNLDELLNPEDKLTSLFSKFLLKEIYVIFFNNIHIATAERATINLFATEILLGRNVGVREKLFNNNELNGKGDKRYAIPIEDGLRDAIDLKYLSKKESAYHYLAEALEQQFLDGGKMGLSEYGEVMYQTEGDHGANLPIHLTASVVKSLSSIIFYFRHIAQKGDFIIIDEPELNLHPDNQRKIARWLVRVVNAGFKVMITTHSDYIIREFNNLIMLQTAKNVETRNKLMEEFGYTAAELLDPKEVGAYLFRKDGTCEDLEINETGFSVDSIDEEISKLNNVAESLYYGLHND